MYQALKNITSTKCLILYYCRKMEKIQVHPQFSKFLQLFGYIGRKKIMDFEIQFKQKY